MAPALAIRAVPGELQPFEPQAARVRDAKLEEQAEFVGWWRERVRGPGKSNSRRSGLIGSEQAEELTGIRQQQVSKWANQP